MSQKFRGFLYVEAHIHRHNNIPSEAGADAESSEAHIKSLIIGIFEILRRFLKADQNIHWS
jgi:hypothetical protein